MAIPIAVAAYSANGATIGINQQHNMAGDPQSRGLALVGNDVYSGRDGDEYVFDKNDLTSGVQSTIGAGVLSHDATGINNMLYWIDNSGTVTETSTSGFTTDGFSFPNSTIGLGSATIGGNHYLTAAHENGFAVYDTNGNQLQSHTPFSQSVSDMTGGDAWAPANAKSLSDLVILNSDDNGNFHAFSNSGNFLEVYSTGMGDTLDGDYDGQRLYGNTSIPGLGGQVYRTDEITVVPTPTSGALTLGGMAGLAALRRRRRSE